MIERESRRLLISRLLGGAAIGAILAATKEEAEAANILFENTQFLAGNSDGVTKRTMTQRTADIFNVLDYGAIGDGNPSHASTNVIAIQAAITAMYASAHKGAILFFPPGNYVINNTIDIVNHNVGSNNTSGIITGSGRWSSYITGNISGGFVFSQADGGNGPEEISNLSLVNTSTVIGTGALFLNNSTCGRILNCNFGGMINILMPFNIFETSIENCTGGAGSDVTTGYAGTFGIAGYHANISGWRTTSPYQAGFQLYGANAVVVQGCGIENCTVGYVLGMATGWASQCTVSGTTLTVGGNLGTTSFPQFVSGAEIFMKGLTTTADWGISPVDPSICTIVSQLSGNPGLDGTYQISRSATIASPVPCVSRYSSVLSSTIILGVQTEGCYFIGFIRSISACSIISCGGGGTVTECVNAFGNTGFTANSGFYVYSGGSSSFINCTPNNNPYNASWYFDPTQVNHFAFINCSGQKLTDNVTSTSSSISNGSGGAGTILNVVSLSAGNGVGVGMRVFVGGVQVAKVTGNHVTDGTLTGTGGTGTYRVDTSQLVTAQVITIKFGDDWILPTANDAKTALQFINCTSANLPAGYTSGLANGLARTYASLPGNVGSNGNFPVQDGMVYDIVDGLAGQCADGTCTTFGTNVNGGGGALHLQVRYNAAAAKWRLVGI